MRKRIEWIDYMKALGIISVVCFHVVDGLHYANSFNGIGYDFITTFTKGVSLFMFFFVSGIFTDSWFKKEHRYMTKIRTLVIPYFIWSILYGLMNVFISQYVNHHTKINFIITLPFYPKWHFWFLYYLFFSFVLLDLLRHLEKKWQIFICSMGLLIGLVLTHYDMKLWILDNFFPYFVLFYIGTYYKKIENVILRAKFRYLVPLFICAFITYSYFFVKSYFGVAYLVSLFSGFLGTLLGIRLLKKLPHIPVFLYIGQKSMPIYMLHVFFTAFSRIIFNKLGIDSTGINIIFGFLVGLVGPIVFYKVSVHFRINKWLFGN